MEQFYISKESISEIANEISENLIAASELGQEFMYQTLIEYGNELGNYLEENKTDEYLIHGCQSTVYIYGNSKDNVLNLQGFADSKLVKGQVAILLKILNGQKIENIINHSQEHIDNFINTTHIVDSLTPSRQNAFGSMYQHIKYLAEKNKNK